MKFPDYLFANSQNNVLLNMSYVPTENSVTYIKRDTLLKWAQEKLQEACDETSVQFDYYENGRIVGKISAFEELIFKLNEN